MPFAYFQRRTVSPSKTKEKKEKNAQKLSFSDERATANEFNDLQNSVDNSDNSQSITQLQEKIDNNTGMPDELKDGVENLSGEDMSDVKVTYNSDQPAQLQANAYASGNDIHVAPGQEKHLPHEAWHVVQQKQNRVKPTIKTDSGELINDDPALEKEADVMGQKALQLKSTEETELKTTNNQNQIIQKNDDKHPSSATRSRSNAVDRDVRGQKANRKPGLGTIHEEREFFDDNAAKVDPLKEATPLTKDIVGETRSRSNARDGEMYEEENKEEEMEGGTRSRSNAKDRDVRGTYTSEEHLNEIFEFSQSLVSTEIFLTYQKAIEISTEAHNNINNIDQSPEQKAENVKNLMIQLNNLKDTKGKIYTRGEGEIVETDVQLGDFKDFNELYIDPVDYLPVKEIKKHANWFKEGATKLDKVAPGQEAGVDFDFGRTQMGERGGSFFAPKEKQDGIISNAMADNGIYTIGEKLALGENLYPWLDENYHKDGTNKGNPDDEIRVITILGDLFSPELQNLFNARIPKGNESGSYPREWLAGGYAQSAKTIEEEKTVMAKLKDEISPNNTRARSNAMDETGLKQNEMARKLLMKLKKVRNAKLIKIATQLSKVPEIVISPISMKRFAEIKQLSHLVKNYKVNLKDKTRKGDPDNGKWSREKK